MYQKLLPILFIAFLFTEVAFSQIRRGDNDLNRNGDFGEDIYASDTVDKAPTGPFNIDSVVVDSPYGPQTARFFYLENVKYNDTIYHYLDTLPDNFNAFDFVRNNRFMMQDLGNLGTAIRPIYFSPVNKIGRQSGYDSYNYYFKAPEKVRYYDTKSPYSSIYAVFGGSNRAIVDVEYSRNVNKNWNFGFNIKAITADKQVGSSGKGDRNVLSYAYDFYNAYRSKDGRYRMLANLSRVKHRVLESGGIVPPEVNLASNLFGYNNDAQVWLQNAESNELMVNYHLYHQFRFTDYLQVYHQLDKTSETINFIDDGVGSDKAYFTKILISDTETADESKFKYFTNEIGMKGDFQQLFYSFYLKRRSVKYIPKYLAAIGTDYENYAGTYLRYNLTDSSAVRFNAEYLLGGDFKIMAGFKNKILDVSYASTKSRPSFMVENYFGNHDEWHHIFASIIANKIDAKMHYKIGSLLLNPLFSISNIQNYIYFNKEKQPEQASKGATILTAGLDFSFKFSKHLHLANRVIYTTIGGDDGDKFRIPELFVNSKFYYENMMFDNVMWAQIGFDMHWQSDYYAMNYDPVISQFYLQDDFEIPSYLLADFFISFKVKRSRWFFKLTNVLQNVEADGYFATPYYTGQKRTFDAGVKWLFFN